MMLWRRSGLFSFPSIRRFCTAQRRRIEDEGDWFYSSEWWETNTNDQRIFRSISNKGNGVVSVLAYPSSQPNEIHWPETEKWLQRRCAEVNQGDGNNDRVRILGYQWRVLRFNEDTCQTTVKVMATYRESEPGSVCVMQQPHCLAVPYVKSMVTVGLSSIASSQYDFVKKEMRVLCIGHGGGSLPLFLASKIPGAIIDIVEIDPIVISASTQAMGFPGFAVMTPSGERAVSKPSTTDEIFWKGIHERLCLYESDAEKFVVDTSNLYDMVFVDAYDGDDIFPHKLWDSNSSFLKSLSDCLHPEHGTVVVNLHSDSDVLNPDQSVLPMGKYVGEVCRAYKDVLLGNAKESNGRAFTVATPWVCNTSLVVCRGFGFGDCSSSSSSREFVCNSLISKSLEVENALQLPFSCLDYIKRDFVLVD